MSARSRPRVIASDHLRANLARELDRLAERREPLYVLKGGRLAGVLVDRDRYAELLDRLEHLEDSVAALLAPVTREQTISWSEARDAGS